MLLLFFFFKQKTAYEMRISDWSSDVCSSDLRGLRLGLGVVRTGEIGRSADGLGNGIVDGLERNFRGLAGRDFLRIGEEAGDMRLQAVVDRQFALHPALEFRSEEHTSELQSLMRISYAVFCLKKKKKYMICNRTNVTRIKQ